MVSQIKVDFYMQLYISLPFKQIFQTLEKTFDGALFENLVSLPAFITRLRKRYVLQIA